MALRGFLEVNDGSDAHLERMLELARRLSQGRSVVLSLDRNTRPRVESMLQALFDEGARARIELVDIDDRGAAIPAVQAAGFCVFSDRAIAEHLGENQVAVYSPSWTAA